MSIITTLTSQPKREVGVVISAFQTANLGLKYRCQRSPRTCAELGLPQPPVLLPQC